MAIIKHREFTIRTEDHCDAKNRKRNPVQLLDRGGYHYKYYPTIGCAEHAIGAWWYWNTRLGLVAEKGVLAQHAERSTRTVTLRQFTRPMGVFKSLAAGLSMANTQFDYSDLS